MKTILLFLAPVLGICAGQTALERLFDGKLNPSQRANACFELRGNSETDVVNAMGKALEDPGILTCAATNLRIAGAKNALAIGTLTHALANPEARIRAAAVRQLGAFQKPELLEAIFQAAQDDTLLVATNALDSLSEYNDPAVIPYLSNLAKKGGMVGDMALDRLSLLESGTALKIARGLLGSSQVPDRLYAMRVMGKFGGKSDLTTLDEIARSTPEVASTRVRGFGFMPAINLARAAESAMAAIQSRLAGAGVN